MRRQPSGRRPPHGRRDRSLSKPDDKLRLLHTEQDIRRRVRELAREINRDYAGKTLHVVGILDKSFLFVADLVRHLTMPVLFHFVKPEIKDSSGDGYPSRVITFVPRIEAANKDILLVDGILQSGLTLDHLYRHFLALKAASVRTALLLEKIYERKVDVPTDYVGFKTKAKYLVGYGLGYEDRYRNLPFIAQLN